MTPPRHRRPLVLVFGENLNDAQSAVHLLVSANATLSGRIKARPRPTSLTRTAGRAAVRSWMGDLAQAVRQSAAAGRPVSAVVVHQDADGPDANGAVAAALGTRLHAHFLTQPAAFPLVPVQMFEAGWFHFPTAAESIAPRAWAGRLPRANRNMDGINEPKFEFQRMTRPTGRAYSEADSPAIAEAVRGGQHPAIGQSASYVRLVHLARLL